MSPYDKDWSTELPEPSNSNIPPAEMPLSAPEDERPTPANDDRPFDPQVFIGK